jgi:hypothetical protein
MNNKILIIIIIVILLIFYNAQQSNFGAQFGGYYEYLDPNIKSVFGDENDINLDTSSDKLLSGSVYSNVFYPFSQSTSEVRFITIFTPKVPKKLTSLWYGYNTLPDMKQLSTELELVNYYLNFDPYASLFMRNDTLYLPIDSNFNIIKYDGDYAGDNHLFSFKSAMALPSDSFLNPNIKQTPGAPIEYNEPTETQIKRVSIIIGVLNAMNNLFNNFKQDTINDPLNSSSSSLTVSVKNTMKAKIINAPADWKGVMNDFYNYYTVDKPYNFALTYNLDPGFNKLYPYPNTTNNLTYWPTENLKFTQNAKHVAWAYLNARSEWINKKILNFRLL